MGRFRTLGLLTGLLIGLWASAAPAQWSVGAPGARQPGPGKHRYAFLVFANPRPGQEQAFNDWYDYEHLGDLVQLPGWTGAQRFRLVTQLDPRPTTRGYQSAYLAWWDQEAATPGQPRAALDRAQDGGKARRSDTFDYVAGASPKALYETLGPRIARGDGRTASIPAATDNVSIREHRFVVLDFADPPSGADREGYEAALIQRIARGLTIDGWIAAQRFRAVPTPGARGAAETPSPFPRDLIAWEVQAPSAQKAQAAYAAAVRSGVLPTPADPATAIITYWRPLGPYVTRASFEH